MVAVVPPSADELPSLLGDELARLDRRIGAASNREQAFERHGYSRLLDLERLLYLLKLLTAYPELDVSHPANRAELEAIVSPLPEGDLRSAQPPFCGSSMEPVLEMPRAIRGDLLWLEEKGFGRIQNISL